MSRQRHSLPSSLNTFGIQLLQQLLSDHCEGNLVTSPISAAVALSMLLLGSGGETASQIASALRLDPETEQQQRPHSFFKEVSRRQLLPVTHFLI